MSKCLGKSPFNIHDIYAYNNVSSLSPYKALILDILGIFSNGSIGGADRDFRKYIKDHFVLVWFCLPKIICQIILQTKDAQNVLKVN